METKKSIKKIDKDNIQGKFIYITKNYNDSLIIVENNEVTYHNIAKRDNYETTTVLELNKTYFMIIDNEIIQLEALEKNDKIYVVETKYEKGLYYKPQSQQVVEPCDEYKELNLLLNYEKPNINYIITPTSKVIKDNKLEEKDCMTRDHYYIIKNNNIKMLSFKYIKNGIYFMQKDEIKKTPTTQEELTELTQTKLDKFKSRIRKR